MNKTIILSAMMLMALGAHAAQKPTRAKGVVEPTWTEWHDQQVNEVNRFPMHTALPTTYHLKDLGNFFGWPMPTSAQQTSIKPT